MVNLLFVCLGNICRSPTAEGIFKKLLKDKDLSEKIFVDSAGTSSWHNGDPPDVRAQKTAKKYKIDLSTIRSRSLVTEDFNRFNYIIAMDTNNFQGILEKCPPTRTGRLFMLLSFAPQLNTIDIPDPYYHDSFDEVFKMIEIASEGLLEKIGKDLNF